MSSDQFCFFFCSDKNNKRKMREVVKEFSLLCRGLLGTEYVEVAKQFL